MSGNEIYLKFKSFFVDTATPRIKAFTASMAKQCSGAARAVAGITAAFGEMPGTLGKIVGGVGKVWTAFMSLGPVGAVIASLTTAFEFFERKFKASCDAVVEASKKALGAVQANFAKVKQGMLDGLAASLAKATTEAQRTAKAFDTLTAAYLKVARAKDATAAAGDNAEIAALRQSKAEAMERAGTDGDAAKIGAEYDIKIAEAVAKASAARMSKAVELAGKESSDAAERARLAQETEAAAKAAVEKARDAETRSKVVRSDGGEFHSKVVAEREKAEKALFDATQARIAAEADAQAAAERVAQAQLESATAASNAAAATSQARKALADIVAAEKKAAQAELDRQRKEAEAKAEADRRERERQQREAGRRLIAERGDAVRAAADNVRDQEQRVRNAESNVTQAWGLYRSPQAFRQQLDEEKAERKAQARFAREAASLQGRSDWRTAQLGRRNESVRRVLLAQEEAQRERARLQKMQNDLAAAKENLAQIKQALDDGVQL